MANMTSMKEAVAIIPIGSVGRPFCQYLGSAVARILECEIDILTALGQPQYAYNPERDQYHSNAIVRRVGQAINRKKHLLGVGVVDVDLFLPDLNFVFGQADRHERAVVVSLARLLPSYHGQTDDSDTTMSRAVAETLHEIGHIFGLPHCQHDTCAMFFSNTLSDTDRKRARYCDTCRTRLAKGIPD